MKIGRQGGKKGEKEEGREQVSREDSREVVCRKATSKSLNNRRIQEGIRLFWYHIESQDTEKHRKHLCPYLPPTPNGDDILQELCQGSHKGHSRGIWSWTLVWIPHGNKAFMPVTLNNPLLDTHFQILSLGFSHIQGCRNMTLVTRGLGERKARWNPKSRKCQLKQPTLTTS